MYSGFFDFILHFKHNHAIKPSTFTKLRDFSQKYRNLSKFSAPAAVKIGHLTDFVTYTYGIPKLAIESGFYFAEYLEM